MGLAKCEEHELRPCCLRPGDSYEVGSALRVCTCMQATRSGSQPLPGNRRTWPCPQGVSSAAPRTPPSRCPAPLMLLSCKAHGMPKRLHNNMLTEQSTPSQGTSACTLHERGSASGVQQAEISVALTLSSCKGAAQVWDAQTRRCLFSMATHTMAITAVKWGGDSHIYSAARDCSINVWDAQVQRVLNMLQTCERPPFSKWLLCMCHSYVLMPLIPRMIYLDNVVKTHNWYAGLNL